jgi:rare lipoprotein A
VRINDRGPFKKGRIIDLSYAAARKIGMLKHGLVKVRVRLLNK